MPNRKITDAQATEIRKKRKMGQRVPLLAKEYNVSRINIYHILERRTFVHIPDPVVDLPSQISVADLGLPEINNDYRGYTFDGVRLYNRFHQVVKSGGITAKGYIRRELTNPYTQKYIRVRYHRLICAYYYGPPPKNKPWALHKNDDKSDNHPNNLYWGDDEDNQQDAIRNDKGVYKLNEDLIMRLRREYQKEPFILVTMAKSLGVGRETLSRAMRGITWKYLNSIVKPIKVKRRRG